jgi:hypothetical protein
MTEHFDHHDAHEHLPAPEHAAIAQDSEQHHKRVHEAAKSAEHDPLLQSLAAIKHRAEQEATSKHQYDSLDDGDDGPASAHTIGMHRQLKNDAYQHTLQKTRRELSAPDRLLSRVIHQPVIDTASTVAANTVGRPAALFAGGLFALIGSSLLLYVAKHNGFTYNYGIFALCLAGGFALGLVVELLWRLARGRRPSA